MIRKLIYVVCTLLISVLLVACIEDEPVFNDVVVSVNINKETGTVLSITTPHQANMIQTGQVARLTVTLDHVLLENERLVFKVNGDIIADKDYTFDGQVIVYEFTKIVDEIVPINVSFDLKGGRWSADAYSLTEPLYTMSSLRKNVLTSMDLTVFDDRGSGLIDYDKIFITFDDITSYYSVVAYDEHTAAIQNLDIPEHDYILAIHKDTLDEENEHIISALMNDDVLNKLILFDKNPSSFSDGESIQIFVYNALEENDFEMVLDEETALPIPVREGFTFLGWWDGVEIIETFMPYYASDDVTAITYEARWFGATIEELYAYIDPLIPETLTSSLELPTVYKNFTLNWHSDDSTILQSDGTYIKPYVAMDVNLTVEILDESGATYERDYMLHIDGKKSLAGTIASSYIYRNYHLVDDLTFDTLDIINTAFIHADASGSLSGTTFLNNVSSYIIPRATTYGTWVVVSIAPDSAWWFGRYVPDSALSSFTATETLIHTFADNVVSLINQYGFDGVDIDWEFPRTDTEEAQYVNLMRILYQKVKENNPNHLVTTAIAGGMWQPAHYRLAQSGQYIDYVNMMAYGLTYNSTYYQNPLFPRYTYHDEILNIGKTLTSTSIDESITILNNYGIPNSKIIVGLAFYGVTQTKIEGVWTS